MEMHMRVWCAHVSSCTWLGEREETLTCELGRSHGGEERPRLGKRAVAEQATFPAVHSDYSCHRCPWDRFSLLPWEPTRLSG